jgi:hypothetical protein
MSVEMMASEIATLGAELLTCTDPLEAEIVGAALLSDGASDGIQDAHHLEPDLEDALVRGLIPAIAAQATPEALAVLLAIGSVAGGRVKPAVSDAAARLVDAGIAQPLWAVELSEPATPVEFWRLTDPSESVSILCGSFRRAGASHVLLVTMDETNCGEASDIGVVPADMFSEIDAMPDLVGSVRQPLDPADFRYEVEGALHVRAEHDREDPHENEEDSDYDALAVLLRARLDKLPRPNKPPLSHGDRGVADDALKQAGIQPASRRARAPKPRMPATRKKADGPAPVYQIKVNLRGTKPPIWRRLEVPADVTLARLHEILQVAFDWDDHHLHMFDTPYGRFGTPDPELGTRSARSVRLEQVAPSTRSTIRYTYDFGDDWEHEILVEKVLDRDEAATYPRCTSGKRAAPPEDCGGVWGYAELRQTLADPDDPDHDDKLDWLGLDDAADFDPDAFDADEITRELGTLRKGRSVR